MKYWLEEEPVIITEGRDCFIKDIDGKWYLDGVSSLWVNIHGHRKSEIDEAIKSQLDKIAHSTLLGLCNEPSIILAKNMSDLLVRHLSSGDPLIKIFYSDNGSTAVDIALKLPTNTGQISV